MSDLGLNDGHEEEVRKYMKFARYARQQQIRSVEGCFEDLKDARLHEDTFTVDEVMEMLDSLQAVVKGSLETELLNSAHTNLLLLVQLFSQAEKWHLKLTADISELENQKLLQEIAEFEEREWTGRKSSRQSSTLLAQKNKLEPLNEGGSTALLQMEIARLNEDNAALKRKVKMLEQHNVSGMDERTKLRSELNEAQLEAQKNRPVIVQNSKEVSMLSEQISTLSLDLQAAEAQYQKKCSNMDEELAQTKHYVLALQNEIEVLTKEFNKKFAETTQYKNIKKMLESKTLQIKELRSSLRKYEPDSEL